MLLSVPGTSRTQVVLTTAKQRVIGYLANYNLKVLCLCSCIYGDRLQKITLLMWNITTSVLVCAFGFMKQLRWHPVVSFPEPKTQSAHVTPPEVPLASCMERRGNGQLRNSEILYGISSSMQTRRFQSNIETSDRNAGSETLFSAGNVLWVAVSCKTLPLETNSAISRLSAFNKFTRHDR
jgi:hypothetical protein